MKCMRRWCAALFDWCIYTNGYCACDARKLYDRYCHHPASIHACVAHNLSYLYLYLNAMPREASHYFISTVKIRVKKIIVLIWSDFCAGVKTKPNHLERSTVCIEWEMWGMYGRIWSFSSAFSNFFAVFLMSSTIDDLLEPVSVLLRDSHVAET